MKVSTVLFNVAKDSVLMKKSDNGLLSLPSIDIKAGTYYISEGYNLIKNFDLNKKDVDLHLVRHEKVLSKCPDYAEEDWNTCVIGGVVTRDFDIANDYTWVNIEDTNTLCNTDGSGMCLVHVHEATKVLKIA